MLLTAGVRLGPYEILSALGAGGMGEVYKARDTRLGRDVAVKVLPASVSTDPDRLQRFEQEARAAAALNHPNILAVYDLGQHDGAPYVVSELLEGETLRERQTAGLLPVRKSIDCAIQTARGLAAAHEKGIVHRDLKPENLFLTTDGRVKILDFGLAKLTQSEPAFAAATAAPTTPHTLPGMVLGTIGYMAPEQARGLAADARSDLFALGVVLYELLSGKRAFSGETPLDTMTAILKEHPPDLPTGERQIPPALARIVDRCLEKDPRSRFQTAADLTFALEALSSSSGSLTAAGDARSPKRRERSAWSVAVLAGLVALAASVVAWRNSGGSGVIAPEMRVEVTTPSTSSPTSLAISPDGRTIAFVALGDGGARLWIRALDTASARALAGTEDATYPFWSPDGKSIGFFADYQLKRMDLATGLIQPLAAAPAGSGGTWNPDNTIVFAPLRVGGLFRTTANGASPAPATELKIPQQTSHSFPEFLPDGRHFVFHVSGGPETRGLYLGQLGNTQASRLVDADSSAFYVAGHLVFVRQQKMLAQAFSLGSLSVSDDVRPIADQVANQVFGNSAFSIARDAATIVYRPGPATVRRRFAWIDRTGTERGHIGEFDDAAVTNPFVTADGRQLVFQRDGNTQLMDLGRGVPNRVNTGAGSSSYPVMSPDHRFIVFQSNRTGRTDLYRAAVAGEDATALLLSSPEIKVPSDWSSDGHFLLYGSLDAASGGYALLAMPMDGEQRQSIPLLKADVNARNAAFSPDGKWIAFQSNALGRWEVFIQPFPGSTGRQPVSVAGGTQPRWRADGKELFYVGLDGRLMAVPIGISAARALNPGAPASLFATHIGGAMQGINRQQYVVAADGQRFLMNTTEDAPASPLMLILNWKGTGGH